LDLCAIKTMRQRALRIWHRRWASATHEDTTPRISRLNLKSDSGIVERSRDASGTRGGHMRYAPFATLFSYLVLTVSSALAQATTTPPGTAPGTASTPGAGAAAGGGGLADWWWIILIVLAVAVAIWYFMRRRGGRV
jgi:hypothetical protein